MKPTVSKYDRRKYTSVLFDLRHRYHMDYATVGGQESFTQFFDMWLVIDSDTIAIDRLVKTL